MSNGNLTRVPWQLCRDVVEAGFRVDGEGTLRECDFSGQILASFFGIGTTQILNGPSGGTLWNSKRAHMSPSSPNRDLWLEWSRLFIRRARLLRFVAWQRAVKKKRPNCESRPSLGNYKCERARQVRPHPEKEARNVKSGAPLRARLQLRDRDSQHSARPLRPSLLRLCNTRRIQ
jgi:hypothetical protein